MCCRRPLTTAKAFSRLGRRYNSTFPPLPPVDEWQQRYYVPIARGRTFIKDPEVAAAVAEAFIPALSKSKKKEESLESHGKVIIEAFPGPGILSRALLSLPRHRVRKLIILEDEHAYLDDLKALAQSDDRVSLFPGSGFFWSTYNHLEDLGEFSDCPFKPWSSGVHPNLHFISHLPVSKLGDQLIAQFFRCIPERIWLFKYGRVPLSLLATEPLWNRVNAPVKSNQYCKLSVIANATAKSSYAVNPSVLRPYNNHFFPSMNSPVEPKRDVAKRLKLDMLAINIVPKKAQVIDSETLGVWDYILRRLFVLKSTTLEKALPSLAPGAINLLKDITSPSPKTGHVVAANKRIRDLDTSDWVRIVEAFQEWPFAPQDLAVTDVLIKDIERK